MSSSSPQAAMIKIGILGCADIARKVSRAITLSPNSTLFAVAGRSQDKAVKFAADNSSFPARTYGSYDAVLDDPEVDAVYIPLPTSLHAKWAVLAANKKKHMLLEKPLALNVDEMDQILAACESNGVQIMDGTMWMHHPRTAQMKQFLSHPNSHFGNLKSIHSQFTFAADEDFLQNDIRVKPDLDALGALGDVGWYCIRSILWAADFELPSSVLALRGTVFNNSGVIIACSASLHWEDGKTATFHCSFLSNLSMDLTVVGTNGTLHLHDFVVPFEENKAGFSTSVKSGFNDLVTAWDPMPIQHTVATDLPQEALMVQEFCRLVRSIKAEGGKPEKKWPAISRKTQLVLNAVKLSIDKGYETVEITG